VMSGRTPVTEHSRLGARTVPIGWGQEMRDQTALIRECVKWDYELRFADQIGVLLDRAHAIAQSTPKGPTYLSLPREVLCKAVPAETVEADIAMRPASAAARPQDLAQLADWIAAAERPLVIAQRGCGSDQAFAAFGQIARDWALPVCHYWANAIAVPTTHPMEIGAEPGPWLAEADLVIVLDSLAPWHPDRHTPAPDARIVQIGPSPLFARTPVRNFRTDLALAGETDETILALAAALAQLSPGPRHADRRTAIAAASARIRADEIAAAERGRAAPMSKAWVSLCLSRAIAKAGRAAIVTSELGAPLAGLALDHPLAWRQEPHSGGLGYALPCAMGMQLARPDALVFATMGDGSYIFANPTACHLTAEALGLPILTIVLNNREWGAVRQSVAGLYPDGHAVRANTRPLTALQPTPDFALTAKASRAYTETVGDGAGLPAALDRAIAAALGDRRQVLLDLHIAPD